MRPTALFAALLGALLLPAGAAVAQPISAGVEPLPSLVPIVDETGFRGTVLVYDLTRDELQATHPAYVDSARIPASTFKIASALAALEVGIISDERSVIRWDGVSRSRTELNRDLDLATAFRLSAVPHFQSLVRAIGAERMTDFLEGIDYGNREIAGGIDQFWLTGDLKISPREQIELLVKLYRDELPLAPRTMEIVRRIMESERTSDVVVRDKTGWATLPEGHEVGWWVGWVERGPNDYFFATMIEADHPGDEFGPVRMEVTRAVLRALGILPQSEAGAEQPL